MGSREEAVQIICDAAYKRVVDPFEMGYQILMDAAGYLQNESLYRWQREERGGMSLVYDYSGGQ